MKVYSDAGHGGKDPGASGGGKREKDATLILDREFSKELEKYKFTVVRTRTKDTFMSLYDRAIKANKSNSDILVSHHLNAYNKKASGIEICYTSKEGMKLANFILKELVDTKVFKNNRGLKHRPGLYMLRKPKMPSVIIEYGFIDNDEERKKVLNSLDKLALASARGVIKYAESKGITKPSNPIDNKHNIMSKARGNVLQMKLWAKSKKADETFIDLADIFYKESIKVGVDPLVVYAQSAKETGYMKFGGVLNKDFKNPCGLKINKGGGCKDPNAHKRFDTWEEGIQAQIDHLALYAGAKNYPKKDTPDPRHFPYLHGKAKTVEDLSGKWAPSKTYGSDIVKMIKEIMNMPKEILSSNEDNKEDITENNKDKPKDESSSWAKEAWEYTYKKGILDGRRPFDNVTREELSQVIYRLKKN